MPFRAALRLVLPVAAIAVAALTTGCGRHYVRYHHVHDGAQVEEAREETVVVRIRHAQKRGKRVFVHTQLTNRSNNTVVVHRDELKLRLADGRELQGGRGHRGRPIVIKPGQTKHVKVGFRAPRHTDLSEARLLMNGVRIAGTKVDSLGEVDLTQGVSTFVLGGARQALRAEDAEVEDGASEEESDEAEDAEPASEEDDEEPSAPQPEEEGWQVGR